MTLKEAILVDIKDPWFWAFSFSDLFWKKYNIDRAYLCGSNSWFTRVGEVAARWNRIIFYDAYGLHSGDIGAPDRLTDDPLTGRLTLNGFFTSRRNVS